uniref:Uncharacterized protein n=1 Tax=viral metagenome TaxID=1070528 RepID=A0A6M3JG96_9ZZZZ
MRLITLRTQALEVIQRWKKQYPNPDRERAEVQKKLEALDLTTALPKDIENIIGNNSWCCKIECDECNEYFDNVLQINEKSEYHTRYICLQCIKKALELFETEKEKCHYL